MASYEYKYTTSAAKDNDGNYQSGSTSSTNSPFSPERITDYQDLDDADDADENFSIGENVYFRDQDNNIVGRGVMVGTTGDGMVVRFDEPGFMGMPPMVSYNIYGDTAYVEGQPVPVSEQAFAVCFNPGTLIATPNGARAVETLTGGDLVLTADGTMRALKWMWRQSMTTVFADPLRGLPVTIRAGALGDGLPLRDLHVSPDHALLIDGMLVHAGALVNGTSVVRMTNLPERFTYYHIELADHALILAEGVAAETFIDNVTRKRFDNWADYEARFGNAPALDELDLPRVKSARQMPQAMRRRLAAIADHVAPQAQAA